MDSSFVPWLDRKVSLYQGVMARECSEVTLREFLFDIPAMVERDVFRVRGMREGEEQSALKRSLPHATVSGLFSGPHSLDCLKGRTGLLCLDIDAKDNPSLSFGRVKEILSPLPYILYIGVSVRGKGVFVIVPLAFPDRIREHFLSLERAFRNKGIVVDGACKDVTRLRCVSCTDDPYLNENAVPYRYTLEVKPRAVRPSADGRSRFRQGGNASRVEALVSRIVEGGVDITEPYDSWFKIGCALHSEFGEDGRRLFHAVSSVSGKYSPQACDLQYDRCGRIGGISIATFFKFCSDAGVKVSYNEDGRG